MLGQTSMSMFDYTVLASYFIVVVGVGLFLGRYIKQAKDFFAAGSSIPWWLAGISLWMAGFSALAFVMFAQLAYKYGIIALILQATISPALFVAAWLFAHRWRRAKVMTPLGFMEQRYSKVVHQLFVWTGIPLRLVDNSIRIFSTAVFLEIAIGMSLWDCIAIVGIIMIVYTIVGGQLAVIVTDFVQFVILALAVILLFPLTFRAIGGFDNFVNQVPQGFFNPFSGPYHVFDILMVLVLNLMSYNATWGYIQKYNCVATEKDARKTAIFAAVLTAIGPFIFFLPVMAARVMMPEMMAGDASRYAYVNLSMAMLPAGMMGLMIAAMFSATISTLGTEFNVLSGVLTHDFYAKKINPNADEKTLIKWGKINTVIIGSLTALFAIGISLIKGFNVYDIMLKAFSALGPAIMLPLLCGILIKKVNARGAITGIITGSVAGLTLVAVNIILLGVYKNRLAVDPTISYWLGQGWTSITLLINLTATIIGLIVGTKMSKTSEEEKSRVDEFFARMSIPSVAAVKTETGEKRSPFWAVGISLVFMGTIVIGGAFVTGLQGLSLFIDTLVGGFMFTLGLILWIKTSVKKVEVVPAFAKTE